MKRTGTYPLFFYRICYVFNFCKNYLRYLGRNGLKPPSTALRKTLASIVFLFAFIRISLAWSTLDSQGDIISKELNGLKQQESRTNFLKAH